MVVQGDSFNASRISTTVVVPLTSNLRLAAAPDNVVLDATGTADRLLEADRNRPY
ncbi:type II toxin-antitoxin system PemK/MazF family toxin [Conexibacter sp. DBS9H8]|uniref:type II toxin-antitoxin system PemK/MazF family toxin n=1 Tax=Conexibacter sp. DBS9H8 TaxID=2937801 RepID=UPI0020105EFD